LILQSLLLHAKMQMFSVIMNLSFSFQINSQIVFIHSFIHSFIFSFSPSHLLGDWLNGGQEARAVSGGATAAGAEEEARGSRWL
jgi:hypothetical protein